MQFQTPPIAKVCSKFFQFQFANDGKVKNLLNIKFAKQNDAKNALVTQWANYFCICNEIQPMTVVSYAL